MKSPAREYLAGVVAFLVLAALAWAGIFRLEYGKPTLQSRWVAELYQEKERIARSIRGPKIVIVGGSSVLFGIRADLLSAALGVPVVNFGTHAGMDLDYLLYKSRDVVAPGDLVLLCIEYELFNGKPRRMSPALLDHVLARDPAYLASLPLDQRLESILMLGGARALKPWIEVAPPNTWPFNLYVSRHMDAHGDTLGNATVLRADIWPPLLAKLEPIGYFPTSRKLDLLGEYVAWCRERGIGVVAVSPPLMQDPAYAKPEFVEKFAVPEDWFRGQHVPLLVSTAEALHPRRVFFDTRYHLDSAGASAFTSRVARVLASEVARWKAQGPRVSASVEAMPAAAPATTADFPLARLVAAFNGWEPVSGMGPFEGPYPQWELGPVLWLVGPEARFRARMEGEGPGRMVGSANATAPGQAFVIAVAGRDVARCTLPHAREFTGFTAELGDVRPFDDVVIRQEGANPDELQHTLLLQAMRIVPSAGTAPAGPACAPPARP